MAEYTCENKACELIEMVPDTCAEGYNLSIGENNVPMICSYSSLKEAYEKILEILNWTHEPEMYHMEMLRIFTAPLPESTCNKITLLIREWGRLEIQKMFDGTEAVRGSHGVCKKCIPKMYE